MLLKDCQRGIQQQQQQQQQQRKAPSGGGVVHQHRHEWNLVVLCCDVEDHCRCPAGSVSRSIQPSLASTLSSVHPLRSYTRPAVLIRSVANHYAAYRSKIVDILKRARVWSCDVMVRALDVQLRRSRVRLPALRFQVTTLGKLFTHVLLSTGSLIRYRSRSGDALRLGK